tara:strand:+ start:580 stop:1377 length:798 start_codon:yes stop_codon:yes gene_type:complete
MIAPKKQINNIYGYVRVSTYEQATSGCSLETQKKLIQEFVQEKFNRPVDHFFEDAGEPGTVPILTRTGSRAMTDVIDEHDIVVTTRLDRLSRTSSDLLNIIPHLEDCGVTLYFCQQFGDIPIAYPKPKEEKGLRSKFDMNEMANKIMLMVLSAVAEIEHGNIKDRFNDGKLDWAAKSYAVGGSAPFGYEKVKEKHGRKTRWKLVEIPAEQKVLKTIEKCRERGLGPRKIAKQVQAYHPDFADFPYWKVRNILNRKVQGLTFQKSN